MSMGWDGTPRWCRSVGLGTSVPFFGGFRTPDCFYLWGWDSYVLFVGQVTPGGI